MAKNFKEWCFENDRQDLLDRWDYELNNFQPDDITMGSERAVLLKCPRGIHKSEPHKIYPLNAPGKSHQALSCKACGSFAQHIIDDYGEEYLNKIWSDKNNKSPWEVPFRTKKKIYLVDENNPDLVNEIAPDSFFHPTTRCIPSDENVPREKSLAIIHPRSVEYWSDKNIKSPYEYRCTSNEKVYWKCDNGKHDDYLREINQARAKNFECPICARYGHGLIDLTGNQYGELTVISYDKTIDKVPYWNCICSCGNHVSIRGSVLRRGDAKTCGDGSHYAGENNPNWKGGCKTESQKIRGTKKYRDFRDSVIKKNNSICLISLQRTDTPNLHHIYPVCDYPEYMFEEWNTIILDDKYHNMFIEGSFHHKYGSKHNTPDQLQEYINEERKKLGINIPFNIYEYIDNIKKNIVA